MDNMDTLWLSEGVQQTPPLVPGYVGNFYTVIQGHNMRRKNCWGDLLSSNPKHVGDFHRWRWALIQKTVIDPIRPSHTKETTQIWKRENWNCTRKNNDEEWLMNRALATLVELAIIGGTEDLWKMLPFTGILFLLIFNVRIGMATNYGPGTYVLIQYQSFQGCFILPSMGRIKENWSYFVSFHHLVCEYQHI